jgi:hypothetical protein
MRDAPSGATRHAPLQNTLQPGRVSPGAPLTTSPAQNVRNHPNFRVEAEVAARQQVAFPSANAPEQTAGPRPGTGEGLCPTIPDTTWPESKGQRSLRGLLLTRTRPGAGERHCNMDKLGTWVLGKQSHNRLPRSIGACNLRATKTLHIISIIEFIICHIIYMGEDTYPNYSRRSCRP